MTVRRIRPVRVVSDSAASLRISAQGRPAEAPAAQNWTSTAIRFVTIGWAAAIIAALVDEFGRPAHVPFLLAMGMTGLLVGASYVLTRHGDPSDGTRAEDLDGPGEPTQDSLTNLPTLKHFLRRLGDEFTRARRIGRNVAIVLVDVNNLTAVNQEYGVRAGDEVLRHVAKNIDATKRFNDVVARLGDDEFGVLLLDSGADGVGAFIDRLEDRLARESVNAEVGGRSISLWAGICTGHATSAPAMQQADAVLEAAMSSLNEAKRERERRRRSWLSA